MAEAVASKSKEAHDTSLPIDRQTGIDRWTDRWTERARETDKRQADYRS